MLRFKKYLQTNYHLPEKDWDLINAYFRLQRIQKNEYFVHEGKVCRHLAFIAEGVMRYLRFEDNGQETTCYFVSENDFGGDPDSFFSSKPSVLNMKSVTSCLLVTFSLNDYQELTKAYPRFREIMKDIDHKTMMNLLNQRDFLLNRDAGSKYKLFMELYPHILQRTPLGYIASYLGIAQQSLSRLRNQIS